MNSVRGGRLFRRVQYPGPGPSSWFADYGRGLGFGKCRMSVAGSPHPKENHGRLFRSIEQVRIVADHGGS